MYVAGESVVCDKYPVWENIEQIVGILKLVGVAAVVVAFFALLGLPELTNNKVENFIWDPQQQLGSF